VVSRRSVSILATNIVKKINFSEAFVGLFGIEKKCE
jgi:hypothetical protein